MIKGSLMRTQEYRFVVLFIVFAITGSVANYAYFYGTLNGAYETYFPTDFALSLLSFRLLAIASLLISLIGILLRSWLGQAMSLISVVVLIGFYVVWYFEKFKWVEIQGIKPGTPKYLRTLNEVGWFRNANWWDMFVLGTVISLLVWTVVRYRTGANRAKHQLR
jgi:hypothetical protein